LDDLAHGCATLIRMRPPRRPKRRVAGCDSVAAPECRRDPTLFSAFFSRRGTQKSRHRSGSGAGRAAVPTHGDLLRERCAQDRRKARSEPPFPSWNPAVLRGARDHRLARAPVGLAQPADPAGPLHRVKGRPVGAGLGSPRFHCRARRARLAYQLLADLVTLGVGLVLDDAAARVRRGDSHVGRRGAR